MRKVILLLLLASLEMSGFASLLFAQETAYRIAGTAVSAESGVALKHVRIQVIPNEHPALAQESVTGDDGQFSFDVAAGKYSLIASRKDLHPQGFGIADSGGGFGTAIVTGPNLKTDHIAFRVFASSAIFGIVKDDLGDVVENAIVELIRSVIDGGVRQNIVVAQTSTDDLGQYRFGKLLPGRYYVSVSGSPWYSGTLPGNESDMRVLGYAPQSYPDTIDSASASPLFLKSGQEKSADFNLRTTESAAVTVSTDLLENQTISGGTATLVRTGSKSKNDYQYAAEFTGPSIVMNSVYPGRYTLTVNATLNGKPVRATKEIDVSLPAIEAHMTLQTLFPMSGEVVQQDCPAALGQNILLHFVDLAQSEHLVASISDGSAFSIPATVPGSFAVFLTGQTQCYVDHIFVDGRPSPDKLIEISESGPPHVKVVLSGKTGRLTGHVRRGNENVDGVLVVLTPAAQSSLPLQIHAFQTDSDGSFDFRALPPGEYRLFATTNVDLEYANPNVAAEFLASAKTVQIKAGNAANEAVDLLTNK